MKLIMGLGNPGSAYRETRHNMGFMVIERLAACHRVSLRTTQRHASREDVPVRAGEYREGRETIRLLMPLTMMNASGDALKGVREEPEAILLVCDDVSLPLGQLRLRPEGSAGGHHGIASCVEALGTERVPRLRVGIGTDDVPRQLETFVLAPFRAQERVLAQRMVERAAQACDTWVKEGMAVAMNQYNKKVECS